MGVERPVTRWFLQRDSLIKEIADLETKLAQLQTQGQQPSTKEEQKALAQQLTDAQSRLHALGPCPKPMMG
jgi:predicted  nucleic acid-binding Zn-ribbon protein